MKWFIGIVFLFFMSCDLAGNLNKTLGSPQLTIRNQSSSDLLFVKWQNNSGDYHYFTSDWDIYCAVDSSYDNPGMKSGHSYGPVTVDAGTGRVYFYFPSNVTFTQYWTSATFDLTNGGTYTITINGSTLISH